MSDAWSRIAEGDVEERERSAAEARRRATWRARSARST